MYKSKGTCMLAAFASFALLLSGCVSRQTRRNHNDLLSELTQLQYEQVLNNVAMYRSGQGKVPHFSVINNSTTQISHSNGLSSTLTWSPFTFMNGTFGPSGTRGLTGQYGGVPVTDAGRLERLGCALQLAVEGYSVAVEPVLVKSSNVGEPEIQVYEVAPSEMNCTNCVRELVRVGLLPAPAPGTEINRGSFQFMTQDAAVEYQQELLASLACHIPTCWFGYGDASDVPSDALYIGTFGDCRTWVTCNEIDALSKFSLSMLQLSTADPIAPTIELKRLLQTADGEIELTGNVSRAITDFVTIQEIEALIIRDDEDTSNLTQDKTNTAHTLLENSATEMINRARMLQPLEAAPSLRNIQISPAAQGLIVVPPSGTP